MIGDDRSQAKKACYAYAFGHNRNEKTKNRNALAVQELIHKNYPDVYEYVWNNKTWKHNRFARMLQNKEAEIFLNNILGELILKDIPALTVHDSIYAMSSSKDEVLKVMTKHLDQAIPGGCYVIDQQN